VFEPKTVGIWVGRDLGKVPAQKVRDLGREAHGRWLCLLGERPALPVGRLQGGLAPAAPLSWLVRAPYARITNLLQIGYSLAFARIRSPLAVAR
jgi:hypothetical protein